ncbi:MAG: phosphopantothenate/pantothenate synthetase [Thermoplasmata archaeon]|nr:phosphopantothenate/pantothenate synthetase [Thermoplasmata archaeon]
MIPRTHPRYESLLIREKLVRGFREGIVHESGLIAHGRGEAFDYLMGEKTIDISENAAKVAASMLLLAKNPVISVNGNVAALVAKECVSLSKAIPAKIEVNLFHRSEKRIRDIADLLRKEGAEMVYGENADKRIPGLDHDRALCESEGIFSADVVLVPLEDGDRCEALRKLGKVVIAIDLNPLSRTARTADVTIVDNVIRAIPNIERWVKKLKGCEKEELVSIANSWDNRSALKEVLSYISKRLNSLADI